jgi:hypothetical protein
MSVARDNEINVYEPRAYMTLALKDVIKMGEFASFRIYDPSSFRPFI